MSKYNKKGEEIVDMRLDAGGKSRGRAVLFTASDREADIKGLLRLILIEQRRMNLHLASMTEENISDRDVSKK